MVTRIDKSSTTRGPSYMLVYRLRLALGAGVVDRALAGDAKAIDKLERFAWEPRKKPGLVRLITHLRGQYGGGESNREYSGRA
jgi:hypothetical protein